MYNPYNLNLYNNPYNSIFQPQQQIQQTNTLPHQQIIQVNGKASVDTIQLAPNSSILVMDTSAPIVWMCVSDGVGKVTSTPYDIVVHEEKSPINIADVEKRLENVEKFVNQLMGEIKNDKSNVTRTKSSKTESN